MNLFEIFAIFIEIMLAIVSFILVFILILWGIRILKDELKIK